MISELIEDFLKMMAAEKGASPNTIEAYRNDMVQFFDICRKNNVKEINKKDIALYMQELSGLGYATRSVARKVSSLREFFKFLYRYLGCYLHIRFSSCIKVYNTCAFLLDKVNMYVHSFF